MLMGDLKSESQLVENLKLVTSRLAATESIPESLIKDILRTLKGWETDGKDCQSPQRIDFFGFGIGDIELDDCQIYLGDLKGFMSAATLTYSVEYSCTGRKTFSQHGFSIKDGFTFGEYDPEFEPNEFQIILINTEEDKFNRGIPDYERWDIHIYVPKGEATLLSEKEKDFLNWLQNYLNCLMGSPEL